tara:strand:+ start:2802 stop:3290 length:489 start_codon:yes stop_codon:yes gene_type:complete
MENRINRLVEIYFIDFKDDMRNLINNTDINNDNKTTLLEFLYNYEKLEITKENITKRKRVKNVLPVNDRCVACRANGEQCTRRRKDTNEYCGTHVKNRPYGVITNVSNSHNTVSVTLRIEEVNGIVYHVDELNNVYDNEDIIKKANMPAIIGKFSSVTGIVE